MPINQPGPWETSSGRSLVKHGIIELSADLVAAVVDAAIRKGRVDTSDVGVMDAATIGRRREAS